MIKERPHSADNVCTASQTTLTETAVLPERALGMVDDPELRARLAPLMPAAAQACDLHVRVLWYHASLVRAWNREELLLISQHQHARTTR